MFRNNSHLNLEFMKMHGLGNDFVVLDHRTRGDILSSAQIRRIADRHFGIGCDQLVVISQDKIADAKLAFFNADGSQSGACGNATRCIARYLMDETGREGVMLATERGNLICKDAGGGMTQVNMGQPLLEWSQIPLSRAVDTLHLPLDGDPVATSMGNPHCSYFVDDVSEIDLERFGPKIEHHDLFPQRTNVQFAHLVGPNHLRMRVWERGVGITLASGSSSCAVAVAAARRDLTGRKVRIDLDGGTLWIDWRADGVWMTGPTAFVARGSINADYLEQA